MRRFEQKYNKRKSVTAIIYKMLAALLMFSLSFVLPPSIAFISASDVYAEGEGTDTSGYTEEEKNAAKAWLSAHGYPPTRAGAEQAYQDFLNGKFDNDPQVRKYKGLDTETDTNGSGDSSNSSGSGDSNEVGSSSGNAGDANGTASNGAASTSGADNDTPDENASDEPIIEMESLDDIMKADFEDELRSSTGLILPVMENKDMYLLYDKYEKKTDNNNTQFYVIISAIAILVIISVFKLIQKDEKEIKQ